VVTPSIPATYPRRGRFILFLDEAVFSRDILFYNELLNGMPRTVRDRSMEWYTFINESFAF
jgi:hypothetical protein